MVLYEKIHSVHSDSANRVNLIGTSLNFFHLLCKLTTLACACFFSAVDFDELDDAVACSSRGISMSKACKI